MLVHYQILSSLTHSCLRIFTQKFITEFLRFTRPKANKFHALADHKPVTSLCV